MESLSRAYVQALAGGARVNLRLEQNQREFDYGVDGTFHPIKQVGKSLCDSGFPLDFQLKATTNWRINDTEIIYSMDAEAYNKLVDRNNDKRAIPQILILFCLPQNPDEWLEANEDRLKLRKCCYWQRLQGELTTNSTTVTVRIPRTQVFHVQSLLQLLDQVTQGVWQ